MSQAAFQETDVLVAEAQSDFRIARKFRPIDLTNTVASQQESPHPSAFSYVAQNPGSPVPGMHSTRVLIPIPTAGSASLLLQNRTSSGIAGDSSCLRGCWLKVARRTAQNHVEIKFTIGTWIISITQCDISLITPLA